MVVNIAWNHSGWARLEPNPKTGFGYTKRGNSAAFSPHEALNFDFSKKGIDDKDSVFGYFQTRGIPRRFKKGGLIFFWSKNTDDGQRYFVGVYGKADVIADKKNKDNKVKWKRPGFETGEFWANIRGEKKLSCLFPCYVKDSAYVLKGERLIYRSNLTYKFDKQKALRLLKEARDADCEKSNRSGSIATITALEEYLKNNL